jgi:hypothetical protein
MDSVLSTGLAEFFAGFLSLEPHMGARLNKDCATRNRPSDFFVKVIHFDSQTKLNLNFLLNSLHEKSWKEGIKGPRVNFGTDNNDQTMDNSTTNITSPFFQQSIFS